MTIETFYVNGPQSSTANSTSYKIEIKIRERLEMAKDCGKNDDNPTLKM